MDGFELCESLDFAAEEDRQKIDKVLDRLERHFVGEVNETFERFKFNQRNQEASELIDAYVSALRMLVKSCNFAALKESLLRDRIVMGIRDDATRRKLLQTRQLDLKMTIDICRANESSSRQVREMRATDDVQKLHSSRKPQPVDVGTQNVPRRSKPQQRASQPTAKCKFCGQEHKFQKELCPAFGRTCKKCKKPNHFADMCRSRFENVRFADMENSSDEELLVLESQRVAEYPKRIYARLELAGEVFKFQLDSGASVNVLPESIYRATVGNKKLRPPQSTLFMYDNSELKTSGILTTTVRNPKTNQAYELDFYVVPRHRQPILGASACQLMELITVRSENIFITDNSSNHQVLTQNNILQSYKDVFSGNGRLEENCISKLIRA